MEDKKLELRMYFLVMYNISPIQQAIQAGHCVEEYSDKYHNTELYKEYRKWKTWIILNGGTSNNGVDLNQYVIGSPIEMGSYFINESLFGSMELYEKYLIENNISYASFREPDLNNALSSLCFICDEKVFDWVNYPAFFNWLLDNQGYKATPEEKKLSPPYIGTEFKPAYDKWVEFVGGENNAKKKELIYGKKLA